MSAEEILSKYERGDEHGHAYYEQGDILAAMNEHAQAIASDAWDAIESAAKEMALRFAEYYRNGLTNMEYAQKTLEQHFHDFKTVFEPAHYPTPPKANQ